MADLPGAPAPEISVPASWAEALAGRGARIRSPTLTRRVARRLPCVRTQGVSGVHRLPPATCGLCRPHHIRMRCPLAGPPHMRSYWSAPPKVGVCRIFRILSDQSAGTGKARGPGQPAASSQSIGLRTFEIHVPVRDLARVLERAADPAPDSPRPAGGGGRASPPARSKAWSLRAVNKTGHSG